MNVRAHRKSSAFAVEAFVVLPCCPAKRKAVALPAENRNSGQLRYSLSRAFLSIPLFPLGCKAATDLDLHTAKSTLFCHSPTVFVPVAGAVTQPSSI